MDSFEEMTGFTVSNSATSDQCKVYEKLGYDITFPLTFLCIGPQNLQGLSTFLTFNESRDELLHSNTEDKTSSDVFDSNVEGALLVNASSKCIFFASFAAFLSWHVTSASWQMYCVQRNSPWNLCIPQPNLEQTWIITACLWRLPSYTLSAIISWYE